MGGAEKAESLVVEALKCSKSKAEKIVACRYPSLIPPLEQIALASLMDKPRDVAFPFIKKKRQAS